MAGVGRIFIKAVANAIVVLVIVSVLISVIFVEQGERELKGMAEEILQAKIRELERRGEVITPEKIEFMRQNIYREYGLLDPKYVRVLRFAWWSITLDFDRFHARAHYAGAKSKTATGVILGALPNTIILFTTATLIVLAIGILLGLQIARKAGGLADKSISTIAMITTSLPMWWVGMLMLLIFAFRLGLAPTASIDVYNELAELSQEYSGPSYWIHSIPVWLKYMWLPLLTVSLVSFGGWAYVIRNVVISIITEDFVNVARAKGLPERVVLYKHVLRAASPPIVTMGALSIVGSLGGAIITETVFSWPGMGRVYWVALQNGDTGVLVAVTYMTSFLFVAVIVLLDLIYSLLDPRIRARGG